jgi:hypothetical protein
MDLGCRKHPKIGRGPGGTGRPSPRAKIYRDSLIAKPARTTSVVYIYVFQYDLEIKNTDMLFSVCMQLGEREGELGGGFQNLVMGVWEHAPPRKCFIFRIRNMIS